MSQYLQALREIAGVEGVFLLSLEGVVLEREMPAYVPDDVLAVVAERADRLFEATAEGAPASDEMLLQFAGASLFLRRFDGMLVGVLASPKLNVEAVRIAANLLRRRLTAKLAPASLGASSASAAAAASFSPPLVPQFSGIASRPSPASAPVSSRAAPVAKAPPPRAPAAPAKPKSKIWG